MFGDTGDKCFFDGAALPIPPWKKGCRIYQADIACHSFEISEAATYVRSCELAMKYDECLANEQAKHTCIEWCPDKDCRTLDYATYLKSSLIGVILIALSNYM